MDLANIIYRYVNRFINSEELINQLENIEKSNYSKNELLEIAKLLEQVKEIVKNVPIEIDKVEEKRLENINYILNSLKKIDKEKLDEETKEFIKKRYESLLKDKECIRDSGPRYQELFDLLTNFSVYNNYCLKVTDLELLEFITQYISVPLPPPINQETFDDLVASGIKEDKKEAIWRLAMNYARKNKDFSKIEDYFIEKRDHYYLAELISGVYEDLDLNRLIKKVLALKDYEFTKKLANTTYLRGIFTSEQEEEVKMFLEQERKDNK